MTDEPTKSPMGWYYRMSPGDYPSVYRCKIGTALSSRTFLGYGASMEAPS